MVPRGIYVDPDGNLLIADTANNLVVEVYQSGGALYQWGLSMSADDIYVIAGDAGAGSGCAADGSAQTGKLDQPGSVTEDSSGNLYLADTSNARVVEEKEALSSSGADELFTVVGHGGNGSCSAGNSASSNVGATSVKISNDFGIAMDPSNNLYVVDSGNNELQEVPGHTGIEWGQKYDHR